MLAAIKRLIARLQALEPGWFQANSWVNEAGGGILGTGLVALGLWFGFALAGISPPSQLHRILSVLIFNGLSALYEWMFDPSADVPGHVPLDDFGQRAAGSLLAAWVWCGAL